MFILKKVDQIVSLKLNVFEVSTLVSAKRFGCLVCWYICRDDASTIQYNTIRVYCENTLSYNNGVLSQTEPKSGSVKARQLIYIYSTNTIKLRVEKKKKLDMEYSII